MKIDRRLLHATAACVLFPVGSLAFAQAPPVDSLADALRGGTALLEMRLRYEQVDDDAFARHAEALTLRTRIGFRTAPWHGWSGLLEAEDVRAPVAHYNSTANGRTAYPVVADPTGSEINQAWLGWSDPRTQVTLGRQRVVLDNQRFLGNSGFRQNEQTFDALALTRTLGKTWTLRYAWLDSVQRVFGNENPNPLLREQDLDAHLLNAAWQLAPGTVSGYGYFVDNQDLPLTSTRTLGLRFAGQHVIGESSRATYAAEYATQAEWRDGDPRIDARYRLIEGTWIAGIHSLRAGHEVLGGDGRSAFQTPFASLHAFNGWADKFLVTPLAGLRDTFLEYGVKLGPGQLALRRHRFEADAGNAHYGDEWDIAYIWPLGKQLTLQAKLADYDADAFSSDTTKFWLALEYRRP